MNDLQKLMHAIILTPICMLGLLQPDGAAAQDASTYYTVMHPEDFDIDWTSFYAQAEERTAEVREQLPHYLNLSYGEHPKQKLDLYIPKGTPSDAPVFLFLHGGGFREGDRAQYGFIAEPFAERGIITAVASYRLTGEGFHYPDQPEDARRAVEWLYRHVAEYGGDPTALYVGGHSAGAILAAEVGVNRAWLAKSGIPTDALRGIVPVSGPYDLRRAGRSGEANAYAPTPEKEIQASPLLNVQNPAPKALVALGSTEERLLASSEQLIKALRKDGVNANLLVLDGEDHKDTVLSLTNRQSPLFKMIMKMIED